MSIFPNSTLTVAEETTETTSITSSPIFNFDTGEVEIIDGKVKMASSKAKIRQWIELLIKTSYEKYKVYEDTGFGLGKLYELQGHSLASTGYGISQIKEDIETQLLMKSEITEVRDISIVDNFNKLSIEVTVIVDDELLTEEVTV